MLFASLASAHFPSAAEQSERRLMRAAIASHEDAAIGGKVETSSPPVRGHTPCSFDDRNHRAEIVRLQVGFKDEVDKPSGEQTVGITVGPEAHELDGTRKPGERSGIVVLEHLRRRSKQCAAGDLGAWPASDR